MRRYRRLRPRRFRQATYLAPPRRMVYPARRMSLFPVFGLVGLLFLAGMVVFLFLV